MLTRTNAGLIGEVIFAREAGKSFHIIGGTAEMELMLKDVVRLKADQRASHNEFYGFHNWHQVQIFVQQSSDNSLSMFVSLVENYTERTLLEILAENCVSPDHADTSFSTVHKAKGLEFDNVVLSDDFSEPTPKRDRVHDQPMGGVKSEVVDCLKDGEAYEFLVEEIRILYVAVTRARAQLQLPSWMYTFFDIDGGPEQSAISSQPAQFNSSTTITGVAMERYAVVDFETSGLSPQSGDRAIEIGIAIVENGLVVDTFDSLMGSDVVIYPEIEELTGITQKMVRRAPEAESVMRTARDFVGEAHLVAHNAAFDKRFWERELRRATGDTQQHDFLCTLLIARRLFQELPNHRLETVAAHLGITNSQHHRALGDATATAELFYKCKSPN